jgi:acyl-coenzyme A thioesterase PaaI-like protein
MPQRRAVENHIGSIHALAMGNLCELAAGLVTEVSIPATMRWIPRGMTIEYLRRAQGRIAATARLEKSEWHGAENVGVPVSVTNAAGEELVRAVITMYVSPREPGA